ncbi:unnamed protein product [Mesocestoides corti]|uniref:Uncharacterized protein n=1 Tax=Mesocestoides corti TaxID=53468 RepID=A0A158QUN8_MESCO|nr:unnamed protein product [Mesocestoides corti]
MEAAPIIESKTSTASEGHITVDHEHKNCNDVANGLPDENSRSNTEILSSGLNFDQVDTSNELISQPPPNFASAVLSTESKLSESSNFSPAKNGTEELHWNDSNGGPNLSSEQPSGSSEENHGDKREFISNLLSPSLLPTKESQSPIFANGPLTLITETVSTNIHQQNHLNSEEEKMKNHSSVKNQENKAIAKHGFSELATEESILRNGKEIDSFNHDQSESLSPELCESGLTNIEQASTRDVCDPTDVKCPESFYAENKLETSSSSDDSKLAVSVAHKMSDGGGDTASNFSSEETENVDDIVSLRTQVLDLSARLLRSQEQMESLLEEKQRWLTSIRQQSSYSKSKPSVSTDAAAIVVRFAQSEQQRMKAEAKIKELEDTVARLSAGSTIPPESTIATEHSVPVDELNKALTEAREKAEHFRHALKQEEARVGDLSAKLNAAREAHRSEQKRAAGQAETIGKLNREVESLKRQLKDADKLREREAKRLCDEVAFQELTDKYKKALADISALRERISKLEEVEKSKLDLEAKHDELQKAHDSLLSVREEMELCEKRETQLSEFTRRLTERNAGLQADYLATQSRLEASERAVAEASQAAREATALAQATDSKLRQERAESAKSVALLEARLSELAQSEATLKAELAKERVQKAALKRKQNALDRELARLMAQQKKLSQQVTTAEALRQDAALEKSFAGSSQSLSTLSEQSFTPFHISDSPHPNPVLGDALLISPGTDGTTTSAQHGAPGEASDCHTDDTVPMIQTIEPNRALLVNKIDRLQRTNVRLMEKIDFLHEHVGQLTLELQKKSRILQHCLVHHDTDEDGGLGAAVPSSVDANKRQRMRRGGTLMSAVFAGDSSLDSNCSTTDLRTSLQINQKLQTVLEDTLYKNFTLKVGCF